MSRSFSCYVKPRNVMTLLTGFTRICPFSTLFAGGLRFGLTTHHHSTSRLLAKMRKKRHFQKSLSGLPSGKWWHSGDTDTSCKLRSGSVFGVFFFPTKLQLFCFRKPSSSASFHYLDADANSLVSQPPNSVAFRGRSLETRNILAHKKTWGLNSPRSLAYAPKPRVVAVSVIWNRSYVAVLNWGRFFVQWQHGKLNLCFASVAACCYRS